jgi:hypothetical protein
LGVLVLAFGETEVAMNCRPRIWAICCASYQTHRWAKIANLISELQTLRKKLQTDGDRIQRDIAEHAELSQQVMQLTTIISDSVKKLPRASGINR